MELKIKKVSEAAKVPEYAHDTDAGMDLFAAEELTLAPGERGLAKTGVAMAIPEGYVGLIWDKSSVPTKKGVTTMAGVIDAGYRGEVMIALLNTTDEPQTFDQGDKVAQMLIQPVVQPTLAEVEELDDTDRGDGGFGSTGK